MKSRWLVIALSAVGLAVILAGCSEKKTATAASPAVVSVWKFGGTPPELVYYKKIVDKYNQDHKNLQINWQTFPLQGATDKVLVATRTHTLPDQVMLNGQGIPDLVSVGAIQPISKAVSASQMQVWSSSYVPEILASTTYQGKVYGLPLFADVSPILTINTGMFKDAGLVNSKGDVEVPQNWNQLLADAEKLNNANHVGLLLPATHAVDVIMFESIAFKDGGRIVDGNKVVVDDPGFLDTLKLYQTLSNEKLIEQGAVSTTFQDTTNAFLHGKGAMALTMTWVPTLEKQFGVALDVKYLMVPFPAPSPIGGPYSSVHSMIEPSTTVMLTSESKNLSADGDLLTFWGSEEAQQGFANGEVLGRIPALKQSYTNPVFQKENPGIYAAYESGDLFKGAEHVPWFPGYTQIEPLIVTAYQSVLTGSASPQRALQTLQKEATQIYATDK